MPIRVQCPNRQCRKVFAAADGLAGRTGRCTRCGATFPIPVPVAAVSTELPSSINRYEVRELLGEGACGRVYRAYDPRLDRDVALKVLRPELLTSPQAVQRFLRESKATAKLIHPHIVTVYDAGCVGALYYIASAFIPGRTLDSAVPEGGMEPRRPADLAGQLASALGYAHQQGVLHRDVKPRNLLLDEQETLNLTDFGLAGWTREEGTRLTQLGTVMGTPAYMAPEQATGDTAVVGTAADLYAAGVVLYQMLTGCLPLAAEHPAALVYQIVHVEPPPPSQRRPGLDAALEAICLKAMAKKPAERYASGEEMAAALDAWTLPVARALPMEGPQAPEPPSVWEQETLVPSSARSAPASPARPGKDRRGRSGLAWGLCGIASLVLMTGLGIAALTYLALPPPEPTSFHWAWPKPPPEEQLPVEIVNSFGMRLKRIEPGAFTMGSPPGEKGNFPEEGPQHRVQITRPFYLGVYPVTQAEYDRVTGEKDPSSSYRGAETAKFPVENVTWDKAAAFCEVLNRKDAGKLAGWKYVLPTEAEWEYACRADTTTAYSFGDDPGNLGDYAWFDENSRSDEHSGLRPHAVGTRKPNSWGLYDMHGNVQMWCADRYGDYPNKPMTDPQGPDEGEYRVVRGGSWGYPPTFCRSAFRRKERQDDCGPGIGLRVCLVPD